MEEPQKPKEIDDPLFTEFKKAIGDWLAGPTYNLVFKAKPGEKEVSREIDLFKLGIDKFEALRHRKDWPFKNS